MDLQSFTEGAYRELLGLTAARYAFSGFRSPPAGPHVILRHDLDTSLQRALSIARIEADRGVKGTYFIFPRSLYYNLLHPESKAVVREILAMGHRPALHFDVSVDHEPGDLLRLIESEKRLVEEEFSCPLDAVSFHLAGNFESRLPKEHVVAGLVNAYSADMRAKYKYLSDSNGVWRFEAWETIIDPDRYPRLHILTHPEWWTPEPLRPRQRIQRAVDGYAARMGAWYDEVTKQYGRPNF